MEFVPVAFLPMSVPPVPVLYQKTSSQYRPRQPGSGIDGVYRRRSSGHVKTVCFRRRSSAHINRRRSITGVGGVPSITCHFKDKCRRAATALKKKKHKQGYKTQRGK